MYQCACRRRLDTRPYLQTTACAYACTGSVLKVQELLALCGPPAEESGEGGEAGGEREGERAASAAEGSLGQDEEGPQSLLQSVAVLGEWKDRGRAWGFQGSEVDRAWRCGCVRPQLHVLVLARPLAELGVLVLP